MSAHGGIFYFDSRPVPTRLVTALGRSLDGYGPDGRKEHIAAGLAMVHRSLIVTPEDAMERQPVVSSAGNVATWDGRLDNRDELLMLLWHDLNDDTSDAALALAAYEKFGRDAFGKLIGDWSIAIWDADSRSIVLATDYMSVRALHYHVRSDCVTWSTTIEPLVTLYGLHDDLEERFIVGYICKAKSPGLTPYRHVYVVPSAHSVTVRSGSCRVERYWQFHSDTIRYRNSADYEAHVRHVFFDGVRTRLRSTRPVWAQLSGGLDSSSVVCAADLLTKRALVTAPDVLTISYISDASPESDERRFMQCVDEQRGRTSTYLTVDNAHQVEDPRSWISPLQSSRHLLETYCYIRDAGGRVLLTGVAGDTVMGNCLDYHYDVAGQLGHGHLMDAISIARRRALAAQRTLFDVLYHACRELFPSARLIRRTLIDLLNQHGGSADGSDDNIANVFMLTPEYAAWWRDEWVRHLREVFAFPDVSQRRPVGELMRVADWQHVQSPSEERLVTNTHPFLHRPLVDLMLGIPATTVVPPGDPRGLMRRAFRSFVPPRIIRRHSKGYASPAIARKFRPIAAEWLKHPEKLRLFQFRCFDKDRLIRYLEAVRDGTTRAGIFRRQLRIEEWLESRALHSRTALEHSHMERR